ncbi:hypothetical protein [Mycobacterium sp. 852002-51961_SCH5331710]|uniref:hypothetical protein n=1 Tax=Mycobacterium sp. 852002-51961_SCH5331710 TaxID=1834105 RepID=UPI0007FDA910|nr:hypothetical protein [Mycobacterium sp. 852002-51961_SCH5331710]OBB47453.1 hypothetical protein A5752_24275 [Mycobacterium sp. 852002-51961_SCH5331710]
MADQSVDDREQGHDSELAVDVRVRVNADTDAETRGVIVEDFGEMTAVAVDIGSNHIADPARRWAVMLDEGTLLFADSDQLTPE